MIFKLWYQKINQTMGISNLNKFLRNNCPNIFELIHISEYSFKKVAVDISLFLCKYKIVCGDRWLAEFINLVACLRRNEIHCIFIYDNGAPPEKDDEKAARSAARTKSEQKVYILEEALKQYFLTGEIAPVIIELHKKKNTSPKRLLKKKKDESIDMNWVEHKIKKMRGYILNIEPGDFDITRELFDILNVPWSYAPLEAETMCADLVKRGLVDAAISEDTDCMAYETPDFLTKLNTTNDTCVRIKYTDILEGLELKSDQFLDLCIMCGTDYNKNIPRVGPEKSYKFLKQFGTIEDVSENTTLDISILHHERGRELFRDYERSPIEKVPFCGMPDFKKLETFMFKHNIKLDIEGLRKSFVQEFVVEDDDADEDEFVVQDEDDDGFVIK
jgi:5'-3' exonuclease